MRRTGKWTLQYQLALGAALMVLMLTACGGQTAQQADATSSSSVPSSSVASSTPSAVSEPAVETQPPIDRGPKAELPDPTQMQAALSKAKVQNPDVRGWLYLPGTTLNGPILQTDGYDYLLWDFDRNPDPFGSITLDYDCVLDNNAPWTLSTNTILCGKNYGTQSEARKTAYDQFQSMRYELEQERKRLNELLENLTPLDAAALQKKWKTFQRNSSYYEYAADFEDYVIRQITNGVDLGYRDDADSPMFGQLFHFTDEQFARDTPYVYLITETGMLPFEVFAVSYSEAMPQLEYYRAEFLPLQFPLLIADFKSRSIYNYQVSVSGSDKILTLYTDTYLYESGWDCRGPDREKLVVMARLVPEGDSLYAKAALTPNPKPKQPLPPPDLR